MARGAHRYGRRSNHRARKLALGLLLLGASLVPVAPAFTASNTGPAGEGSHGISGYAVSNIRFGLDSADPSRLAEVSFSLAPATAQHVQVQLAPGGAWFSCRVAGASVDCPVTGSPADAGSLDVVAA